MEVKRIEVGGASKFGIIKYGDASPAKLKHSVAAQLLDNSVNMYFAHANGLPEQLLRGGEPKGRPVRASDNFQSREKLQHQVRQAAIS